MTNVFDQFDAPAGNPFDQFDTVSKHEPIPENASAMDIALASMRVADNTEKEKGAKIAPDIIRRAARSNPFTMALYPFIASRQDDTLRNAFQGITLGTGDEITAGIRSLAGEKYDNALLDERSRLSAQKESDPLSAYTAEGVGSLLPLAALRGKARPSLMGRMYESSKLGALVGGVEGFNKGEDGVENRVQNALKTAALTGLTAAGLTPAIEAAGGMVNVLGSLSKRVGSKLPVVGDPNTVPDELMLRAINRTGKTPAELQAEYEAGQKLVNSRTIKRNPAENYLPETIADIGGDPTQRLARSVRQIPGEGSRLAGETLANRQAGKLDFTLPNKNAPPANQFERVVEDLKTGLGVADKDANYGRVVNLMKNERSQDALNSYNYSFFKQEAYDLSPAIQRLEYELTQQPGLAQNRAIRQALAIFTNPKVNIGGDLAIFDRGKRSLDASIQKLRKDDAYSAALLTAFKHDLLQAVHAGGKNPLYAAARQQYSTKSELLDAVEMGRNFIQNKGVTTADIEALGPAQKTAANIGALEGLKLKLAPKRLGPTADFTANLRSPEMIGKLRTLMSDHQDAAKYLTDMINREARISRTSNVVLGNSTTNEKIADTMDLSKFAAWSQRLKDAGGAFQAAMTFADSHIQKLLGMNEQNAAIIARQIFSSNPRIVKATLGRLQAKYGQASVRQLVSSIQQNVQRIAAGTGGLINAGPNQQ